jgi:hypothetical protein
MSAAESDLAQLAEPVARQLFGEPNARLSRKGELRFGSNGSWSVDLAKGTVYSHELGEGGGVLWLVEKQTGLTGAERFDWLRQNGFDLPQRDGAKVQSRIVETYDYTDEGGNLLFQVCRLEPKSFRQRKPDGRGGWEWTVKGVRQVPYKLPEVTEAIALGRQVAIVEGEKDVERLARNGIVATCNAGGAGKWPDGFGEFFTGAEVLLIPDNDEAGEAHMALVGTALDGVATSVRILRLKGLPPKGDVSDWFDKGGKADELGALMARAPEWLPPAAGFASRLGAVRFRDLDLPGPEHDYLIKGILTRGERSLLVGPSGAGKSFVATDLSWCVATGSEFLGRRVRRGLVVYQAGEGARGLKKRLRAIRKEKAVDPNQNVPFVLLTSPVDLYASDADTQALIKEIDQWSSLYRAEENVPLELVVIDTLSAATPGANENASEDMSKILTRCALIAKHCNCHVMLVHHLNAAGSKPRGHSSLFANIENAIEVAITERTVTVERADGSTFQRPVHSAKVTKQKDDESGTAWDFALKRVVLGKDMDGDDISSCVVVGTKDDGEVTVAGAERTSGEGKGGFKLTKQEGMFFECVLDALAEHGINPPPPLQLPESIGKVVDYEHVKAMMTRRMLREDDNTEDGRKRHRERLKSALRRARETLTKYKIVGTDSPYIWHTGKPVRGFEQTQPRRRDLVTRAEAPADDTDLGEFA